MSTGLIGPPAGFLSRVTTLEREVSFLKQKVEDDARWKHLLENWILDNFAFDLRGALLAKEKSERAANTKSGPSREHSKRSSKVREKERRPEIKRSPLVKKCRSDSDGGEEAMYSNEGIEVNVDPRDLIILPDCPSGSEDADGEAHREFKNSETESDYAPDSGDSESEDEKPKKNKKMEWTLHSSYSSMECLKQHFNMRDWALWTTSRTVDATKVYYYCKGCRKNGPGRLMLRFRNQDSEVEIYKNQLEHDHSRKNRITDEVRSEIMNLYKAGMKTSTQIISSFKISKPDLRVPSPKQVCYVLRPQKKKDRKDKRLVANNEEKKLKNKKPIKKDDGAVGLNTACHFQSPDPSSGFNPLTLQTYATTPVYQHSGGYDPTPIHLQHQQFHSL